MEHNVGTGSQALPITFISSKNDEDYFTATNPGFLEFAITGQVNLTAGKGLGMIPHTRRLCQSPIAPDFCQQKIASFYLTSSRRRRANYSGEMTVFSGIIASAKREGEAIEVKRAIVRVLIFTRRSE